MSNHQSSKPPAALVLWVLFCSFCGFLGWTLSALHQLNRVGYAVGFIIATAALILYRERVISPAQRAMSWVKHRRRFRHAFPMAFLLLASLAFLGGVLYAPSNYDALAYRTPRVLHWLAEQRWHWIHTEFNRLNTRACAFEWVSAPLIAFARTDRFLFVINIISFFLLPGLIFSVFTRLGVSRRVAWYWMWIVPTGYCFLLQAGSIGNDLFGAVFALAALDFALRARSSQAPRDVWLSFLAAGLVTGSKGSNLPLLLPWLIAVAPSFKFIRHKLVLTSAIAMVAILASFVPTAAMNVKYCGDWTGAAAEHSEYLRGKPLLRLGNNAVLLTIQNLVPPVFPFANTWNRNAQRWMPVAWRTELEKSFEPFGAHWGLSELEIEESAGLGFGVTFLVLLSFGAGIACSYRSAARPLASLNSSAHSKLVVASAVVALAVLMAKFGLGAISRLVAAFYALCIPVFLLARSQEAVVRTKWWRCATLLVFFLAAVPMVLSPARPLWPANSLLARADGRNSHLLTRAKTVYSVYRERFDAFAPARKLLPAGLNVLGVVISDDPETSLWRPFGHLRVEHVTAADSPQDLHSRSIEYVVVNTAILERDFQQPIEQWLAKMGGEMEAKLSLELRASGGPSDWCLVKLHTDGGR
jgi:hypothetical protein